MNGVDIWEGKCAMRENNINFTRLGLTYYTFDVNRAIFVYNNDGFPTTYLYEEIILISNELKKYGITYTIDAQHNLILNI